MAHKVAPTLKWQNRNRNVSLSRGVYSVEMTTGKVIPRTYTPGKT